jgi:leucyl aminopeptidase
LQKDTISFPTSPSHADKVNQLISGISTTDLKDTLSELSGFKNRLYTSKYGKESSVWLKEQVCNVLSSLDESDCVAVHHDKWEQVSIIARFPGTSPDADERNQVVIVGSHLDSVTKTNLYEPDSRSPGADDDGE